MARHRLPDRGPRSVASSKGNVVIGAVATSVASAGVLAGVVAALVDPASSAATGVAVRQSQSDPRPFSQQGTLIAVSPDSVTARSENGFTQTYRITPHTTAVTDVPQSPDAAARFAVNDQVAIVAEVQNGTAVATAVADRELTGPDGPPMDSIAG